MKKSNYTAQNIDVLKGLDPVRHRPGMYTRTENPNHIIQEIIDNAQDEALAGYAKNISVELNADGSITVEDDGRGIPVDKHPTENKPVIEIVFTVLHAGGKFRNNEEGSYGFTGGLHGVGVSVTNALSKKLNVTVYRNGYEHTISFVDGFIDKPLTRKKLPKELSDKTGTKVTSYPDPKYFDNPNLNLQEMERFLRSKAVLLKGCKVSWQRPQKPLITWSFPGGLEQYLNEQVNDSGDSENQWIAPIFSTEKFYEEANESFFQGEGFELALGWSIENKTVKESYVNLIPTPSGGRHETGLRSGLLEAFRVVADRMGAVPKGIKLDIDDIWSSLSFVLSVKLRDPQFQNQTKDRMTSEKGQRLVFGLLKDVLELWLNDHPQYAKDLIEVMVANAIRRSKQGNKTERKKSVGASVLPGKLSDCQTKDVSKAELFLVEGNSAGGCFVGSTKVMLADKSTISIEDMANSNNEFFGFTTNDDKKIIKHKLINPRLTKHKALVGKITFSNGESEICTPCHLFRLADGSYCEASKLTKEKKLLSVNDISFENFEYLPKREDVYDLEVPRFHNFALASGAFVHNSSKQGRDRTHQAILPLRGKLLNTWDVDSHTAMLSETIHDISSAIGVDPHTLEDVEKADLSKLRYHKIFIMADADVDGQHIQVLILTLFLRHFPALITNGHIWIARAPLFRVDAPAKKGSKSGPRKIYALDDNELQSIIKQLEKEGLKDTNISVSRFKGLGEMNSDQLFETTMNPETRRSVKITLPDAKKALVSFDKMMNGKNAKLRKEWMELEGADIEVD